MTVDGSGLNIVDVVEAIAGAVPERECILWRDRQLSWADVHDRTRRLANALLAAGVGGDDIDHAGIAGWESPHDHVALYLTNGNEYLEGMLGAWKARAAAINVNYRYTAEELEFLLRDAHVAAVVYHARFAPVLAEALRGLDPLRALVVVDDGSGTEPVPGSLPYEQLLADSPADRPPLHWSPDDRYVVYTGGTTGNPKGVLWRQGDFLHTALGIRGTVDELVERASRPGRPRALPAPPFMHGAAHWNALSCLLAGGTVVIQEHTEHLDPADVLDTCEHHRVGSLLIVGDAFARPLLDELRRRSRDLSSLRFLMTGGAVLSPSLKAQLVAEVPGLRVVDILGSSETGRHGLATTTAEPDADDAPGVFTPSETTVVLDESRTRRLEPGETERGWLAQRGRVPLGYLGDEDKTRATFPRIDGVVHAVAGDRARLLADGRIELLGRDSVTINTGGEKVHAEEVEQAVKAHPGVYDALVVGRPSERWGSEIVAVVAVTDAFDPDDVRRVAGQHLARYKLPKDFVVVDRIRRSASGKPDYAWARELASRDDRAAAVEDPV